MVYQKYIRNFFITACLIMLALGGCGSKEGKSGSEKAELQKPEVQQSEQPSSESTVSSSITQSAGSGIVIDVDGAKLTKEQLESEVKKKMSIIKNRCLLIVNSKSKRMFGSRLLMTL